MRTKLSLITAAIVAVVAVAAISSPADARRRHHHHYGYGYGAGGFVAGALLGSAITAPRYYGGGPYYYGGGPYYGGAYASAPGGSVEYCMQRYRSYDPRSGTYMGYDGQRHPCP
jgi:hypothetical protein